MNLTVNNYTDSVLAALVISIKAEMAEMYKEQLHALAKLNQEVDMVSESEALCNAAKDLRELSEAINIIEEALDREFKPKPVIRTSQTALCPNCHHRVPHISHSYCHWCGQKLAKVKAAVPRE